MPIRGRGQGKPLAEHLAEAREYAALLEAQVGTQAVSAPPPPPLQKSQTVTWNDFSRIVTAVSKLLANAADSPERRWRKVLFVVSTLRKARLDGRGNAEKAVTGGRLNELLHILGEEADHEVPVSPDDVSRPGWVGRMVFRPLVALYARKDSGTERGPAQSSALGRLLSAIQFARGKGSVPHVHAAIGSVTFADAEKPLPKLSDKAVSLLTGWSRVKVESGQCCGPTNFRLAVWDGLESLAAAFAAVMWLARVLAAGGNTTDDALTIAVRMVDDNWLQQTARQRAAEVRAAAPRLARRTAETRRLVRENRISRITNALRVGIRFAPQSIV